MRDLIDLIEDSDSTSLGYEEKIQQLSKQCNLRQDIVDWFNQFSQIATMYQNRDEKLDQLMLRHSLDKNDIEKKVVIPFN